MPALSTINKAPGVYIQEITLPGPIAGVSTSNVAIVGPAEKGPIFQPTPLTNINQFWTTFGTYIEVPYRVYAAHAVNGFFNEGGALCYFVRVGNGQPASLNLADRAATQQTTLVAAAQQEGVAGNAITVQVDDASIASTTAANPQATVSATSADKTNITVTAAGDAANFKPGDTVLIRQAANSDTATIASIRGTTINFQTPLTNTYTGGTVSIANLSPGQTQIRVAAVAGFEPGSYVSISNGTATEGGVVRVVNRTTNVLTLTNGLTNAYTMGQGAAAVAFASREFTLTVVSANAGTEVFANLAMDPRHSRYFGNLVNSAAVNVVLADPPSTSPPPNNLPAAIAPAHLANGQNDNLGTLAASDYHKGIDALRKISDVNLLCVPDCVSQASNSHFTPVDTHDIQAYMIAHCERMQDRFAILDCTEMQASATTFDPVVNQRQSLSSDNGYGALYFPWIGISNPFGSGQIFVPPSGHVAGVFATNDNNPGVYKAPANEPVISALSLEVVVSDDEQGPLNEQGINVIRSFPSQGILIWGARTIAPPDMTAWRYVNVRRLLLYIEKSIQGGTRFAVFEPNNLTLWQQIKRLVTDFLTGLWTEGALFGDTPDKAFRVRVDETLNPPAVTALGQLIIQVTVVPTHPAEFIIFQIIQDPTGASLTESAS
jgi:phage tail sheath protein FI